MIYQSNKMVYAPVMEVLKGNVNEVLICRNAFSEQRSYYTLLVIHDHGIVKRLFSAIEQSKHGYTCCVEIFQQGDVYCAVFPYVKERRMQSFYMPAQVSLETCGKICENLILSCMLSKLPYPLLYLVLEQEQLHLLKDDNVELGCTIDLSELDEKIGEKECVRQCAVVLRELLKVRKDKENTAYQLFNRRWDYESFGSLYRDMRLVKRTMKRHKRLTRLRMIFQSRLEGMSKLLRVICMGMIALALLSLLSRAMWGEIPFLRVFVNHFKAIGTESLTG